MAIIPRRIAANSDPAAYSDSHLFTLAEAAALLFPDGPLTASSLRTAYKQRKLEVIIVARKVLVTKVQVAQMIENARRTGPPKGGSEEAPEGGSGSGTAKQRQNIRK
jgi:hypothetical protein